LGSHYIWLHIIGWGFPTAITITAFAMNAIQYKIGTTCIVSQEYSSLLLWPLIIFHFPAFCIHVITSCWIAWMARKEKLERNKRLSFLPPGSTSVPEMIGVISVQWRTMTFATCLLGTFLTFWWWFFIDLKGFHPNENPIFDLISTSPIQSWLTCIMNEQSSDACVSFANKLVPIFDVMAIAEAFISTDGIWLFLVFFCREEVWKGWQIWIIDHWWLLREKYRWKKGGEKFLEREMSNWISTTKK